MKFTEMEDINKETDNSAREAFMDLLYGLQDYISNDFYNEKVEKPEQVSKIYNTISDLEAKFSDYEDTCSEDEKSQAADYCTEMYDVIDALKKLHLLFLHNHQIFLQIHLFFLRKYLQTF